MAARRKRGWAMAFCVLVLRRPLMLVTRRDWRRGQQIPSDGGCVVVTNHVSEIDACTFAHFVYDQGRLPRFLGKAEVFKVAVVGAILRSAGQIPVFRRSSDASQAFSAAVAAVESGECVVFYPEGTLTRDPGLWPMVGRTGAVRVALMTGCPVIPTAQWGPNEILPPYARRPRLFPRKVMHVYAGSPVDLSDLEGKPLSPETLQLGTQRVMAAITSLLEEIRGESAPPERFDPRSAGVSELGNPNKPRGPSSAAGDTASAGARDPEERDKPA